MFVLDNYSTDGTWEFLQDNNISSNRIDTNGSFDLRILQRARTKIVEEQNPDWVIYGDGDEFIMTDESLRQVIENNEKNYRTIAMRNIDFYYTGEERQQRDPREMFFYCRIKNPLIRIHRTDGFQGYKADSILLRNKKTLTIEGGCIWDFGMTKPWWKREDTRKRRKKAWSEGMERLGRHYEQGKAVHWRWGKKDLQDIRESKYWEVYLKNKQWIDKNEQN